MCFGDWMVQNVTELDYLVEKMADMELSYEDAKVGAIDLVNLAYNNFEYCEFSKFFSDNVEYFDDLDMYGDDFLYETMLPSL